MKPISSLPAVQFLPCGGFTYVPPSDWKGFTVIVSNGVVDIDNDNPITVNHEFVGGIDQSFFNTKPFETRELNRLLSRVEYEGGYDHMQDTNEAVPATSEEFYDALASNLGRSNQQIKVEVHPGQQDPFELRIALDGQLTYSEGFSDWNAGELLIQAHWGSGVAFTGMTITEPEEE